MMDKLLDIIKWGLILIIAGAVYIGIEQYTNRYTIVGGDWGYKMDKFTGETWALTANKQIKVIPYVLKP